MYCSNCGKKLNDGDNFCPGCGIMVTESQRISAEMRQRKEFFGIDDLNDIEVPLKKEEISVNKTGKTLGIVGFCSSIFDVVLIFTLDLVIDIEYLGVIWLMLTLSLGVMSLIFCLVGLKTRRNPKAMPIVGLIHSVMAILLSLPL